MLTFRIVIYMFKIVITSKAMDKHMKQGLLFIQNDCLKFLSLVRLLDSLSSVIWDTIIVQKL